jgi:hypothetical protein
MGKLERCDLSRGGGWLAYFKSLRILSLQGLSHATQCSLLPPSSIENVKGIDGSRFASATNLSDRKSGVPMDDG